MQETIMTVNKDMMAAKTIALNLRGILVMVSDALLWFQNHIQQGLWIVDKGKVTRVLHGNDRDST